jgi:hypothetical protein
MKTWEGRAKTLSDGRYCHAKVTSLQHGSDPAGIALTFSKRMVSIMKYKKIVNIEASLEMMALAMTICSEVHLFHTNLNYSTNFLLTRILACFPKCLRMSKVS